MFQSERPSNVKEHNLPVVRQGRPGCCPLLCRNLSRKRGRAVHLNAARHLGYLLAVTFRASHLPRLMLGDGFGALE